MEGFSLCVRTLATGKSQELFRQLDKDYRPGSFRLLGWSSDDQRFAYTRFKNRPEIVLVDTVTLKECAAIEAEVGNAAVWVDRRTLVYVDDHGGFYQIFEHGPEWHRRRFARVGTGAHVGAGRIENLISYLPGSVAWQQGGALWTCAVDADEPTKLLELRPGVLLHSRYSDRSGSFLLHCREDTGDSLATFHPDSGAFILRQRLAVADPAPIADWVGDEAWINAGRGYAYRTRHDDGTDMLWLRPAPEATTLPVAWPNLIRAFSANDTHVYVTGSRFHRPTAIWRVDVQTGESVEVVGNGASWVASTLVTPIPFTFTHRSGQRRLGELYVPSRLDRTKLYPLVIGTARIGYEQAIANAGAFFASARRYVNEGSEADDFPAIQEALRHHEQIDARKIYLLGTSRGTKPVVDELRREGHGWAGAILLSPNHVPDLSGLGPGRLFIDHGEVDPAMDDGGFKRMESEIGKARGRGLSIVHAVRRGVGHFYRAQRAETERIEDLIHFLRED